MSTGLPRLRNVLLHVTHRCDLDCQHCFQTPDSHPEHDAMSREEIRGVLADLARAGALFVTFTGGEPFLRRDLMELIADARGMRFAVILKTAGHHIDATKARRLKDLGVHEVQISLYSHLPEVADAFTRRPGSHRRTVAALQHLRDAGVRTNMRAAMTTFNYQHLRELRALGQSLGAVVQFDPSVYVRTNGDRSSQELALTPAQRAEAMRSIGMSPSSLAADVTELCNGDGGFRHSDRHMCGAARHTVSISATGEVHACVLHPHSAGNAVRDGFSRIWRDSPLLQDIRSITYGELARTGCSGCGHQATCHPCMALAATEHGDSRACNSSSLATAEALRLMAAQEAGLRVEDLPEPTPPAHLRGGRGMLRVIS